MTDNMQARDTQADDAHWMQQALELAALGRGLVEPNPMVGCVIVADGKLLGGGYHEKFGGPHAERNALAQVPKGDSLQHATAYVTLEPCCHHGKTPPCTDAILESGVRQVVVAMQDPFAEVAGQGIERLRAAGVEVRLGVMEAEARRLNAAYIKCLTQKLPWVIAKWAMSLDGKIATRSGDSQWISGPESRQWVHGLRSRVDAIVVGRRTAELDDPQLTARIKSPLPRVALRVVLDSHAKLSIASKLAQTARQQPVIVWAGPQADASRVEALRQLGVTVCVSSTEDANARLYDLLRYLCQERQATNVLVEGGGELLGSLLEIQQVDQCEVFIGPRIIGGSGAASPIAGLGFETLLASPEVIASQSRQLGADIHLSCQLAFKQTDTGPKSQ